MTTWIIEPRDPVIFRDGRPFNATPGARAESLPFPFPSTLAGAARTRAGRDESGTFVAAPDAVRRIAIRGPLLVRLDQDGAGARLLAPAPADALLAAIEGEERQVMRRRVVPLQPFDGALYHRPAEAPRETWLPVGPVTPNASKLISGAPRYWYWPEFEAWLTSPAEGPVVPASLGLPGPTPESRMHVGIDPKTGRAAEHQLFQTNGLAFATFPSRFPGGGDGDEAVRRLSQIVPLGLVLDVTIPSGSAFRIRPGLDWLAGERRLVHWRTGDLTLPACPPKISDIVARQGACRLVLLTPAHFRRGAVPEWLLQPREGVRPALYGMAVPRAQVVSGWSYEDGRRGPKPSRRLAPAGSVYFLRLDGDEAARRRWVETLWMRCVSDDEQDRLDGFGLAVIGAWDGKPAQMTIGE